MKTGYTVIIGGGQAGLATGYYLMKKKADFIILDRKKRTGDSWRERWDSLKLFTPAQYDGLPGLPFPDLRDTFPGKDKMAEYLENYADEFSLPVQHNVVVQSISPVNSHYEIETSEGKTGATNVVVATGTNPFPYIPAFAAELSHDIFQIHSSKYLNNSSVPEGDVLVVGAGTSGAEIALELSGTHKTYISGRPTFHIPDPLLKYAGGLYWWFVSNVLTINTPMGRRARPQILKGGAPLIRISMSDLDQACVTRLPRVSGVADGYPRFEDDSRLKISSIVWATGYRPDFSWIKTGNSFAGWPESDRGISKTHKGLYFVGMPFQFGLTSGLVGGVGRDAGYIADHIGKA